MSFLLDTNAFSAIVRADQPIADWIGEVDEDELFISVLTVGDIRRGLELLPTGRKKRDLSSATDQLVADYADRVLPVSEAIARRWGDLSARYRGSGIVVGVVDELIAATALSRGLVVVTRNIRHFQHSGCPLFNPWPS